MGLSGLFTGEVTDRVDHVEGGVKLLLDREVGHISDDGGRFEAVSFESLVAVRNRLLVEIVSSDLIARLGELNHQPPRPAGRLEDSLDRTLRILLEARFEKLVLGRPIRTENEVVVLGVVVQMTGDSFHKPLGDVRPVVDAGGLFNYARQTGMIAAKV